MSVDDKSAAQMRHATFVILCAGRVGSEFLVSLLDSHPDICCYGEVFTPPFEPNEQWFNPYLPDGVKAFTQSEQDDPRLYIAELASGCAGIAVGFKLTNSSIEAHPGSVGTLEGLQVIRLTRENLLAQHVSGVLAYTTGAWKQGTGTESYGATTHRVDAAGCKRALAALERREQELDGLAEGHPTIRLTYERLVAGPIDEVQQFLRCGAPRPQLPSPQTSHPPAA